MERSQNAKDLAQNMADTFISLHVIPKSSKNQIVGWIAGVDSKPVLKVKITAPPEDGKANAALIKFLAKSWGIPASQIEVSTGSASRHKRLKINGNISNSLAACLAGRDVIKASF